MTDRVLPFKKWHVMLLAIVAVAMLVLASPAMRVQAAQSQIPPAQDEQQLELLYDRVTLVADNQGNRIEYSKVIAAESQAWIDTLKEDGQDVSTLEDALATFNAEIAKAEETHSMALDELSAHAGFDDAGNVTDMSQAGETIRAVINPLRQTHLTLTQATLDFHSVIIEWRQEHEA